MLSSSVSAWISSVLPSRPHASNSDLPRTGGGLPGLGNHLRMLQVLQFGPPTMARRLPCCRQGAEGVVRLVPEEVLVLVSSFPDLVERQDSG